LCNLWCKSNLISIISRVSATAWQHAGSTRRRRWRLWLASPSMTSFRYVPYVASIGWKPRLRLRSHRHECESEYRIRVPTSKTHEFACISVTAVHTDTSSVRVRVTCGFHSYEKFLCRSCFFIQPVWSEHHKIFINLIYTGHGVINKIIKPCSRLSTVCG